MRRILLLLIWAVLCVGLAVTAAESTQEQTHKWDSLRSKPIYFRLESSIIDSSFGKNDEALQQLGFIFTDITTISRLNSVRITATTSPDGNPAYNRILASRRVKTVKNYIEQNYPYMDQNKIVTYGYVENWMRLRPMISKQTPNYLQIVSILDQQPTPQATESHLRTIDGGKAWGEIPTSTQPTFLIEEPVSATEVTTTSNGIIKAIGVNSVFRLLIAEVTLTKSDAIYRWRTHWGSAICELLTASTQQRYTQVVYRDLSVSVATRSTE